MTASSELDKKILIIDCDPGVDDAHAIMMALARPNVEVMAITVVRGNCSVDQGCINALRILRVCNKLKIPVFRGASEAMLGQDFGFQSHEGIHGNDGMGDVPEPNPPKLGMVQEEHASQAIVRLVKEHKGKVTLVAIGPLTNVALAVRLFPQLGSYLKDTIIMGGNIEGKGNTTPSAEFNFAADPESAHIVLNSLNGLIKLVSWETSGLHSHNLLDWEWFDYWMQVSSLQGRFIRAITLKNAKFKRDLLEKSKYNSRDPLAMAVAIDDTVVMESTAGFCDVELNGRLTRGQMVVDWNNLSHESVSRTCRTNVNVITHLDVDRIKNMLEWASGL